MDLKVVDKPVVREPKQGKPKRGMSFGDERNMWREISGIIVCSRSTYYLDSLIDKVKEFK